MRTKLKAMTRGTYEGDAEHIETADDLDDQMLDNREVQRTNVEKLGGDKDDKETHQRKVGLEGKIMYRSIMLQDNIVQNCYSQNVG